MANGIEITLYDGSTPRANETGITACWWDYTDPADFSWPLGKATGLSTDSNGVLTLDLTRVTGQQTGDWGYLLLRKEDSQDHRNSLVFQGKVQISDVTGGTLVPPNFGWTYPREWPDIRPRPTSGTQIAKVLYAVYPPKALVAFLCTTSAGQYRVNWGDGTSGDHNSNVQAERIYDYNNTNLHDTGLGYKIAQVEITPISGNIATIDFCKRHTNAYNNNSWSNPLVTAMCNLPYATSIKFGGSSYQCSNLEAVYVYQHNLASSSGMFMNCYSLAHVDAYIPSVSSMTYMFYGCSSLCVYPGCLNLSSISTLDYAFQNCYALKEFPTITGTTNLSATNMFMSCYSLRRLKITRPLSSISNMCANCYSLREAEINVNGASTMSSTFGSCSSARRLVLNNCSNLTSTTTPFNQCYSLNGIRLNGIRVSVSVANSSLSGAALNELFTSLGTPSTTQTITVTGNYGINDSDYDPSIATAKNWTVTA